MRNRGIELFVVDEAASPELLPAGHAQHEELMMLSLGGVPGTALPAAMAAAHTAVVQQAQGSYRSADLCSLLWTRSQLLLRSAGYKA